MTAPEDPALEEALRRMAEKNHPSLQANTHGCAMLSICAALLCPGLGHFLAGYYRRSVIWFVIVAALIAGMLTGFMIPRYVSTVPLFLPLAALAEISQLLDAVYCGAHARTTMLGDPIVRYLTAFALGAMAFMLEHTAVNYLLVQCFEICYTPTSSMAPTVGTTDWFVDRRGAPFTRWDIVVAISPDPQYTQIFKRVIGLPGDKIEITGDGVLINDQLATLPAGVDRYVPLDSEGNLLDGPSGDAAIGCWGKPITLGPDEYFLLGDNSPVSGDSRFFPSIEGHQPGAMPRDQIMARVTAIVWPPSRWRTFPSPTDSPTR